jgi:hypothetical protein
MPLPGTGPISLGNLRTEFGLTGPVSLANVKNWGAAQHGAGVSLANFRGVSSALWVYPPPGMPTSTAWTKPATLVNGLRYATANVSTAPYANGVYNAYMSQQWWNYVDATGSMSGAEQGPPGMCYRPSSDGTGVSCTFSYQLSSTADGTPMVYTLDFPSPITVFAYKVMARTQCCPEQIPQKWTLDGSADKVTWTTVDTRSGVNNWILGSANHFSVPVRSPKKFQYWRLSVTRNGGGLVCVSKLMLFCPEQPVAAVAPTDFIHINAQTVGLSGGYNGGPYVSYFSGRYSFSAQPVTANVATNGGFTAMTLAAFTGNGSASNERIFDFGEQSTSNNIVIARFGTTPQALFGVYSGATLYSATTASNVITQGAWNLWTARYFASNNAMQLYQDGALVATATGVAFANRVLPQTYVGRSCNSGDPYSLVNVKNIAMWDRALSDAEVETANVFLRNDTGALPTGTISTFSVASLMVPVMSGFTANVGNVATFNLFNAPTVSDTGGYNGGPYVGFSTPSSQYAASTGSLTFNITTNGGYTAMTMAKFVGPFNQSYERVFDFGAGGFSQSLILCRSAGTQAFFYTSTGSIAGGTIVQDAWNLWTCRYFTSNNAMQLYQNGSLVATGTATGMPNRTLSTCYFAKSNNPDPYGNVWVKNCAIWDRALSDAEITTATAYLRNDTGSLPAGNVVNFSVGAVRNWTFANGISASWSSTKNASNVSLAYGLGASPSSYAVYGPVTASPTMMSNVFAANTVYTIQATPVGWTGSGPALACTATSPQLQAASSAVVYLKPTSNVVPTAGNLGNPLTVVGTASTVLDASRGYVLSLSAGGLLNTAVPPGNSYTKAAWVYATAAPGANAVHLLSSTTGSPGHYLFLNAGVLSAGQDTSALSVCVADPAGNSFPSNAWVHVAYTYNKTTNTAVLYKNGLAVASNTAVAAWTAGATTPVCIGGYGNASSWTGYLDDVRVHSAVLSAAQIQQLQAPLQAATDPLWANVVFRAVYDTDWNDYKNGLIGVQNSPGTGTITFATPTPTGLGGQAVRFSPTSGDGIGIRYTSSAFNLGTGPVTIEFWAYFDAVPAKLTSVVSSTNNNFVAGTWRINYDTSYSMNFGVYPNSSGLGAPLSGTTWYHICGMRVGTGLYLFVNGAPYASSANAISTTDFMGATVFPGTTYGLDVGCNSYLNQAFYGRVDDLRITAAQRYPLTGFTPPTGPLPCG